MKKSAEVRKTMSNSACGYTVLPDKRIRLAPMEADKLERLLEEQQALSVLVEQHNAFLHARHTAIAKRRNEIWRHFKEGLGTDYIADCFYRDGYLFPPEPKVEPEKTKGQSS